jgi:hypothetical protein
MFGSQRAVQAAREEIVRLRRELEQAITSLARYKDQERELLDALIGSRTQARQIRTVAEDEAREIVERAREEAAAVRAQAQAQMQAAHSEIARLRDVPYGLSVSLQPGLVAHGSVTPQVDRPAAPLPAPILGVPASAPVTAPSAIQWKTERAVGSAAAIHPGRSGGVPVVAAPVPGRDQPVAPSSWNSEGTGHSAGRKRFIVAGVGALALMSVILTVTVPAVWRRVTAPPNNRNPAPSSRVRNRPGGQAGPGSSGAVTADRSAHSARIAGESTPYPNVTVTLKILRPVWLRAEVDGRIALARLLRAGEVFQLRGTHAVVVRAGDAGAVLIGVNGRAGTVLGHDGAVVTKRIAPNQPASTEKPRPSESSRTPPSPVAVSAANVKAKTAPASTVASERGQRLQSETMATGKEHTPTRSTVVPSQQTPSSAEERDSVLRGHKAYFDALSRGDAAQLARLIGVGFSVTGTPSADESGLPYEIALDTPSVEIRGLGAVVSGTASQRITEGDGRQVGDQPLLYSEVWIKRDGEWQLLNVRFVRAGRRP